jgi:hypothetical chaperone protein
MTPVMHQIGIDFGTTNSAVAIARPGEPPRLLEFPGFAGEPEPMWRTVLYFEPDADRAGDGIAAGGPAIRGYLDNEGDGRLLQSIKSHLASALFTRTQIMGRSYSLEALIAVYLRKMRDAAPIDLGRRAVVGRPVRYWGATDDDDDQRAVDRMREALALAGFDEVVFELEPVAAAARYAARSRGTERVLIADFGGGTSDFSVLQVGADLPVGDPSAILATGGVGIGGDSFDGRIIDAVIAPALGKGTGYLTELGQEAPVPAWLYTRLRRWHHLSFLKSRKTLALLDRLQRGAVDRPRIDNLVRVIEGDLGLPLHQSVERAKVELSRADGGMLRFAAGGVGLASALSRADFDDWIAAELAAIDQVIDRVLGDAGVDASAIDRVFATGGSSLVPAIRGLLARRFGRDKLVGGEELTSVAWGLAARAGAAF